MATITTEPKKKEPSQAILILSTLLITSCLFFVDEGHYDFNWIKNVGSWIVFSVYASAIYFGQIFISQVLLNNIQGRGKTILSIIGGSIIGVVFVIFFVFTNW